MAQRPKSLPLIEQLIAFDTVSAKSNLTLIEFVRGYLLENGVECRLVHNAEGTKANLYATIGPLDRPGIMLSGHTDVVPVEGQDWHSDPFQVLEKNDRLYGRGTADMKSFVAIALALVPEMLAADLSTPIHLAFSYDEEIGCVGVRRLLDMMEGMPIKPAMCVVGEPTGMKVVVGHKGKRAFRVRVKGLECHSSLAPQGVNAVDYAAKMVVFIQDMASRMAGRGRRDEDYVVPYTTIHTGTIHGGTALNIVPQDCAFDFEIRNLPDEDPAGLVAEIEDYARAKLEPKMQEISTATGISFEQLSGYPGLNTDPSEEVVTFVKSLIGASDHAKITFGTEGGLFHSRIGIPTVVCGPGHIAQAHKPNEWIAFDQLGLCEAFMEQLIKRLSG